MSQIHLDYDDRAEGNKLPDNNIHAVPSKENEQMFQRKQKPARSSVKISAETEKRIKHVKAFLSCNLRWAIPFMLMAFLPS